MPVNRARARISVRYRANLPEAMELAAEIGLPEFARRAADAHSLEDIFSEAT
jgi:hypothetical protein